MKPKLSRRTERWGDTLVQNLSNHYIHLLLVFRGICFVRRWLGHGREGSIRRLHMVMLNVAKRKRYENRLEIHIVLHYDCAVILAMN